MYLVTVTIEHVRRVVLRRVRIGTVAEEEPTRRKGDLMKLLIRLFTLMVTTALFAQAPPFSTGLLAPSKLIFTHQGNLVVSEQAGVPNSGRVSLIDRTTGARRTLVAGLPSALFTGAEPASPTGVSGLALHGQTLYITIGSGDGTIAGPAPGSEQPNPAGPSSPIFSSVLSLEGSRSLDVTQGDFALQPSQHTTLKNGSPVTLTNSAGETLEIRLVADFADYVPSPRPDFPGNVKNANPFGIVAHGNALFVVDASQNIIRRVDPRDGSSSTLTAFPLIGATPPIEAVPDSIRLRGSELLVPTLTGFPFPAGAATVSRVNLHSGEIIPIATGFTTAIDVAPLGMQPSAPLLVLEFSTDMLGGGLGRLRLWSPESEAVTVAENLVTPLSVIADRRAGEAFVALMGPGVVVRIPIAHLVSPGPPSAVVAGVARSTGMHGSRWMTHSLMHNPHPFPISGRIIFRAQGATAASSDPSMTYTLAPYETRGFPDLVGAIGGDGLGSLDIVAAAGPVPVMTIRVVDENSADKPATLMPLMDPSTAITAGFSGAVVAPPDIAVQRMNIGIRTLDEGATIRVVQRGPVGELISETTHTFPSNYFLQLPADHLTGAAIGGRNSIAFEVQEGSAFIYAAVVQNNGKGVMVQTARPH